MRIGFAQISAIVGDVDEGPNSFQKMKDYIVSRQKMVDDALEAYLPKSSVKPKTIHKAMRYSIFAGGKRLRPILCLAAGECCGGETDSGYPPGMRRRMYSHLLTDPRRPAVHG